MALILGVLISAIRVPGALPGYTLFGPSSAQPKSTEAPITKGESQQPHGVLSSRLAGNPLFVAHVVHIARGVPLKLAQAIDGAEVESFRVIVVAGGCVSNADFHFADWIDGHGRFLPLTVIRKSEETFAQEQSAVSIQHSAGNILANSDKNPCNPEERRI
jgi:hypothetical protein